jgi:hypothetical protein
MRIRLTATLFLLASTALLEANAPREPAEGRTSSFDAQVIACDSPSVLGRIQSRFDRRENGPWKSGLLMTSIDRVRETGFRSNGQDLIPRRFCTARALLSTGQFHTLTYNLSEDGGRFGWHGSLLLGSVNFPTPSSFHLEWCLSGLDRHRTYGPDCAAARP